jgi:hypothetical protein
MLHDVVIVGAGPVGAAAAVALSDGGLDVVTLDARAAGAIGRGDRSLALSHGSRLIFERLGVWGEVAAAQHAVTPITAIDVSQQSGFGHVRLDAAEQGLPALGYVVSYRALQAALDAAIARSGHRVVHGAAVTRISATSAYAMVEAERRDAHRADEPAGRRCRWRRQHGPRFQAPPPRLPTGGRGRPALAASPARGRRVRAVYAGRAHGAAARGGPLRLRVDDNAGAGRSAARIARRRIHGGARAAAGRVSSGQRLGGA